MIVRLLDAELLGKVLVMDQNFDPSRLGFALESIGACQEAFIRTAASSTKHALAAADAAGFNLFMNELANDQASILLLRVGLLRCCVLHVSDTVRLV